MQTQFSPSQLADPATARANEILRSCVHCGFCTATCPTYKVLGDELDSPRGRIYLIKDMLENQRQPSATMVKHIDRCLGCLSCMTTCPSGVNYMHLIDHARDYVEARYKRPFSDRLLRALIASVLPYPKRFRAALRLGKLAKPFKALMPDRRLRAMLDMVPKSLPSPSASSAPNIHRAKGQKLRRVALLAGCAQPVLNTQINEAAIRVLTRHGCEVVVIRDLGCCGALTHHMGRSADSMAKAAQLIGRITQEAKDAGLDAFVITTSGCGTTIKDYGHLFAAHPLAEDAAFVAALTKDISEILAELDLTRRADLPKTRVAYQAACSLQHGQKIKDIPKALLQDMGFDVVEPADAHLCCGSAGSYNLLQPEIASALQKLKVGTLEATRPDVIAGGNIGCMMQIGAASTRPIVHMVELIDWASGGPRPSALPALVDANQDLD